MIQKYTTIIVKDLEESLDFYINIIGLKKVNKFSPESGVTISFLKDEESNLIELLEDKNLPEEDFKESRVSIGFGVDNLDETLKRLKENGFETIKDTIETPGDGKLAFIKDPNGVEIGLNQGFNMK